MSSRKQKRPNSPWFFLGPFLILLLACAGSGSGDDADSSLDTATQPDGAVSDTGQNPDGASSPDTQNPPTSSPGAVTLHRLNRAEYNNTVRDLLDDDTQPADDFPADDHGFGFDNIADVLSMSPLLMEKYDIATEQLLDETLFREVFATEIQTFQVEEMELDLGGSSGGFWNLWASGGEAWSPISVNGSGQYLVTVRAAGQQAGPELAIMRLRVDEQTHDLEVTAKAVAPATYQAVFSLEAGEHEIGIRFANDFYDPDAGEDRNLLVDWLEIVGPYSETTKLSSWEVEATLPASEFQGYGLLSTGVSWSEPWSVDKSGTHRFDLRVSQAVDSVDPSIFALLLNGTQLHTWEVLNELDLAELVSVTTSVDAGEHSLEIQHISGPALLVDFVRVFGATELEQAPDPERRAAIMICAPADSSESECTRTILEAFARRAWRRPVSSEELTKLAELALLARDLTGDFETGVRTALHAILLSPHFLFRVEVDPALGTGTAHPVTQHELATRMSYALWSTMPDTELSQLADEGQLADPAVVEAQVQRMLDDPKSQALIDNFAGQWLELRKMDDLVRDSVLFPDFNEDLRFSMRKSTELTFAEYLRTPIDFLSMLTTEVQYINPALAELYGLEPPEFDEFERRTLSDPNRHGILSHASVLSLTSHTFGTSPVLRGKWILSQWMCQEPPPPPPEVDTLLEEGDENYTTKREQLAKHQEDPMCAGCHSMMDPLGLSLENYDAIGQWRDYEGDFLIDPSGTLPSGVSFESPIEMAQIVEDDSATALCVARHLFTYLLGRGVEAGDVAAMNEIVEQWEQRGFILEELFLLIAQSPMFQYRMPPELPEEEAQ